MVKELVNNPHRKRCEKCGIFIKEKSWHPHVILCEKHFYEMSELCRERIPLMLKLLCRIISSSEISEEEKNDVFIKARELFSIPNEYKDEDFTQLLIRFGERYSDTDNQLYDDMNSALQNLTNAIKDQK